MALGSLPDSGREVGHELRRQLSHESEESGTSRRQTISNSGHFTLNTFNDFLQAPRWSSVTSSPIAQALTPSFVPFSTTTKATTVRKLHATAWLDGLRGVASLLVVFHHSSWLWYPELSRGYGSSPTSYWFVQLPIIRIFYASGSAMVAIFFIVSGFSLSYKALSLIRGGRQPEILDSLSSSVFRRGLRLVLPPAVTTFFSMIAAVMRFYGTGPNSREPPVFETAGENIMSWISGVVELADPYRPLIFPGGYNPTYDTNLWTIPVEFHGSMMIFLTLLGVAKLRGPFRLAILVCSVLFLFYNVYSQIFLFMSGTLLAELHHFRESRAADRQGATQQGLQAMEMEEPKEQNTATEQYHAKAIPVLWTCNFVVSLFVCSMPLQIHGSADSPGYMTLASLVPASYSKPYVEDCFWIPLGAFNLIWTLDNAKFLQIIFTNRFSQYLGKISFALYIVHGTFLYTVGWNLSAFMLSYTGGDTGPHYAFGLILTGLIMYPLIFWTADMVARHVDAKSVKFARWLWLKVIAP